MPLERPYAAIAAKLTAVGSRAERMQRVVDALWDALHALDVSWVGFYLHEGRDELVLGPRRNKPACSPIGLHGACGQAFRRLQPLIVRDVADLGAGYIACDPRDRSEVVLALLDDDGTCWGVLDLDSHSVGAFDERDVAGLRQVLAAAGFRAA